MSDHDYYPYVSYPVAQAVDDSFFCRELIDLALIGAVAGGAAAAARNAGRLRRAEVALGEAMMDTGRAAVVSGAATAVAAAAAGAVAEQGVLRLSLMFGVGAAVLYGFDRWSEEKETGDA